VVHSMLIKIEKQIRLGLLVISSLLINIVWLRDSFAFLFLAYRVSFSPSASFSSSSSNKRRYRRSLATTGVYGLLRNYFLNSTWRINADVKSRARIKTTRLLTKAGPSSFQYSHFLFDLPKHKSSTWSVTRRGDSGDFLAARLA